MTMLETFIKKARLFFATYHNTVAFFVTIYGNVVTLLRSVTLSLICGLVFSITAY